MTVYSLQEIINRILNTDGSLNIDLASVQNALNIVFDEETNSIKVNASNATGGVKVETTETTVNYITIVNGNSGHAAEVKADSDTDDDVDIVVKGKGRGKIDQSSSLTLLKGYYENKVTATNVTGTYDIDLSQANNFDITIGAGAVTFTLSNAESGYEHPFCLKITQNSTAQTITWPSGSRWPGGTAGDLSTNSGIYRVVGVTNDGGTTIDLALAMSELAAP